MFSLRRKGRRSSDVDSSFLTAKMGAIKDFTDAFAGYALFNMTCYAFIGIIPCCSGYRAQKR